jgi:hypothetical protein
VKKGTIIFLLLIFSFQTFYGGCFTMWFFANRNYVAQQLCVNKKKPVLKCNGKCYLSKKLKESNEENEQQPSPSIKQWQETSPCILSIFQFNISSPSQVKVYQPAPVSRYHFFPYLDVFHPPSILLS